jgi:16S rRNA (cytosine967-C5)-methyltransferase
VAVAPARLAAFRILLGVEAEARHADDLLHGEALRGLTPRDRGLATTLVMGTLRWQLLLDAEIAQLLRPGTRLADEVAIAVRLGLFQLWFLDRVPAHAALSESVDLVKMHGFAAMAALVNAVLRKLSRAEAPRENVASAMAHPEWMVARWTRTYGQDKAERIAIADQQAPTPVVRVADGRSAPEESSPGLLLIAAAIMAQSSDAAGRRELRVQDEGSQLVAEIAASVGASAERVLDACAAPGGKTAILAERLPTAEIVACDISGTRLKTMERLLPKSLAARVRMVRADAEQLPVGAPFVPAFDLILCDVPCSGTGTLARNPEIRLRLQQGDFVEQARRQSAILASCFGRVRPGGVLVYSTCSLEPEENQAVVDSFLKSQTAAEVVPIAGVLAELSNQGRLTEDGAKLLQSSAVHGKYLRTLPGIHPCEGFFVAVLRRL